MRYVSMLLWQPQGVLSRVSSLAEVGKAPEKRRSDPKPQALNQKAAHVGHVGAIPSPLY